MGELNVNLPVQAANGNRSDVVERRCAVVGPFQFAVDRLTTQAACPVVTLADNGEVNGLCHISAVSGSSNEVDRVAVNALAGLGAEGIGRMLGGELLRAHTADAIKVRSLAYRQCELLRLAMGADVGAPAAGVRTVDVFRVCYSAGEWLVAQLACALAA